MKKLLQRSGLFGLTLALALGIGFHVHVIPVRAQAADTTSASPTQADSNNSQPVHDETDEYRKSPMVVSLGAKLGLNAEQSSIAFAVANFLLLAAGIGWLLVKQLPVFFRGRDSAIQKHLVDARTATEEARTRLGSVEVRLAKLDGEIAAMRTHAEQDATDEEQRIKASVEDEKRKILAEAEQEIAVATMHAQKLLQQHAAELAIDQAARKLVISAETDRLLVQGFAQRLTGDGSKKGQN